MQKHCELLFGYLAHIGVTEPVHDEKKRLGYRKAAAFTDLLLTFVKKRDRDIRKLIVYRVQTGMHIL